MAKLPSLPFTNYKDVQCFMPGVALISCLQARFACSFVMHRYALATLDNAFGVRSMLAELSNRYLDTTLVPLALKFNATLYLCKDN